MSESSWSPPEELRQAPPRPVRPAGNFPLLVVTFGALMAFPLGLMAREALRLHNFHSFNKTAAVAEGAVWAKSYGSHYVSGTHGASGREVLDYFVSYRYRAPPAASNPSGSYLRKAQVNPDKYFQLQFNQKVRVLYDPANPIRARLEFENAVPSADGSGSIPAPARFVFFAYGILAMMVGIVPLVLVVYYLRVRHVLRWGAVAPARITSVDKQVGKAGYLVNVTFDFTDAKGSYMTGLANGILTDSAYEGGLWGWVKSNPTVVYDPKDISRNYLYRPSIAEVKPAWEGH